MSAIVILTWAFERKSDIFRAEVEDNDDCEMESDNRELIHTELLDLAWCESYLINKEIKW